MLLSLLLSSALAQEPLTTGEIFVGVAPGLSGRILLDGIDTGVDAPATITGVMPGEHRIQVRGNCLMGMAFVTVESGHLSRADVDLQTTGGFLEVSVQPTAATILLDEEVIGTGPTVGLEVTCGEHLVEVRAAPFPTQTQRVVVDMGTALSVSIDLAVEPESSPEAELVPGRGRGVRRGVAIGIGVLSVGALGAGGYIHRLAHTDYRNYYVPAFEACEDLACQEELQDYRTETIARRYYGGMILAGAGFVGLTTAGVVGFAVDGTPLFGVSRRF